MSDPLDRDRRRLLHMLRELSFERRSVTLASGRPSDFYIDCRRTALTAEGHFLVGRLLFDAIRKHAPGATAVGGMTLGADPLASSVSLTSYLAGQPLTAFIVRKEAKGHGMGNWIEGRALLVKGDKVAVVDDVVTSGGSTLQALDKVKEEGLTAVACFALVDRGEGGREAIEARGVKLHALFGRTDFIGN